MAISGRPLPGDIRKEIVRLLRFGMSMRKIARHCGVCVATVDKLKKGMEGSRVGFKRNVNRPRNDESKSGLYRGEGALMQADQHKNEFLARLARELRKPLAPVRNSLETLKGAKNDVQLTEQALAVMERHIGRMVRLIDDLDRSLERSEGGLAPRETINRGIHFHGCFCQFVPIP